MNFPISVFLELHNGKVVGIPWGFSNEEIERKPKKGSESLFADLIPIAIYQVNSEGKSIAEVVEARKKREASLWG